MWLAGITASAPQFSQGRMPSASSPYPCSSPHLRQKARPSAAAARMCFLLNCLTVFSPLKEGPNMSLNVLPCGDDVAMVHGAMTVVKLVDGAMGKIYVGRHSWSV